jgi:formylglycine-generating enzyme required for sulfatase activity
MKFIHFEGSEFLMGARDEDPGDVEDYEKPQHKALLDAFGIAATCVTRGEWQEFLRESNYPWGFDLGAAQRSPSLEHPAVFVSWFDAVAFCVWKSKLLRKTIRLPTEAEWEFVCQRVALERAENQTTFRRWCERFEDLNPVAGFSTLPQETGVFGMWEGVSEWCLDSFDENAYGKLPATNPVMLGPTKFKGFRGGSPLSAAYPRCSYRGFLEPTERTPVLGFRPVMSEINTQWAP